MVDHVGFEPTTGGYEPSALTIELMVRMAGVTRIELVQTESKSAALPLG